jgi:CBS domain-containing protein
MVRAPQTLPVDVTVAEAYRALAGGHVHMLLLTDGRTLLGTLLHDDLAAATAAGVSGSDLALPLATLRGRTVLPDASATEVERELSERGSRRLAVVDSAGDLLGLLCLKRRGRGFCSDEDVTSRSRSRGGATA